MLSLLPLVLGSSSVAVDVGRCWSLHIRGRSRIHDSNVNAESVGPLNELDVSPYVSGVFTCSENLTDNTFHSEMRLLDTRMEFLDQLVEQVTNGIMAGVARSLVEAAAESVERVLSGIKRLMTGAYSKCA